MSSHTTKTGAATAVLLTEHKTILKTLDLLEKAVFLYRDGYRVSLDYFEDLLFVFTLYADRSHHGKEEEILFPTLEKQGVKPEEGPVEILLEEHQSGRTCLRNFRAGLAQLHNKNPEGGSVLISAALDYSRLLREHILKEDEFFYDLVEHVLDDPAQQEMVAEFEKLELDKMGEVTPASVQAIIAELEQRAENNSF